MKPDSYCIQITNHALWSCCMTICQVPFSFYIFTQRSDYFVQTPDTHTPCRVGSVGSRSASRTVGREFASRPGHTKDHHNKSANALALCHPPSASFCSVLAVQWSSRIFTHDRYNIPSDILIEFEVNLGIIIEKYA